MQKHNTPVVFQRSKHDVPKTSDFQQIQKKPLLGHAVNQHSQDIFIITILLVGNKILHPKTNMDTQNESK